MHFVRAAISGSFSLQIQWLKSVALVELLWVRWLLKAQSRWSASPLNITFHEQKSSPLCWVRQGVMPSKHPHTCAVNLLGVSTEAPWLLPCGLEGRLDGETCSSFPCLRSYVKSGFLHRAVINLKWILLGEWLGHRLGVWLCLFIYAHLKKTHEV